MSKIYGNGLCCLLFLAFFHTAVQAQSKLDFSITTTDQKEAVLKNYRYPRQVADSLEAFRVVSELVSALHNDGYLLATTRSVLAKEESIEASLQVGERFEWLSLRLGNLEKARRAHVSY